MYPHTLFAQNLLSIAFSFGLTSKVLIFQHGFPQNIQSKGEAQRFFARNRKLSLYPCYFKFSELRWVNRRLYRGLFWRRRWLFSEELEVQVVMETDDMLLTVGRLKFEAVV